VFLSDEHRECDIRRSNFNSNRSWRNCHFLPPIITPSSKHAPIWYYPNGTMQSYSYNPFYSIYTSYSSDWSSETGQDITCAVLSKCTHVISDYLVVRIGIDKIQSVTATSITHTAHPSSNISIAVQRSDSRRNEGQLFPPDTCIIQFDRKTKYGNSHVVHFRGIFSPLLLFLCTTDQLCLQQPRLEKNMRSSGPIGTVNFRVSVGN